MVISTGVLSDTPWAALLEVGGLWTLAVLLTLAMELTVQRIYGIVLAAAQQGTALIDKRSHGSVLIVVRSPGTGLKDTLAADLCGSTGGR